MIVQGGTIIAGKMKNSQGESMKTLKDTYHGIEGNIFTNQPVKFCMIL